MGDRLGRLSGAVSFFECCVRRKAPKRKKIFKNSTRHDRFSNDENPFLPGGKFKLNFNERAHLIDCQVLDVNLDSGGFTACEHMFMQQGLEACCSPVSHPSDSDEQPRA